MTLADTFSYDGACAYIEDAAKLGSRPGLERIDALCDALGHPEEKLSFIHIAGTNGKGSTACMIATALSAAHLKVGMYYSPALTGIRDHFMIDNVLIPEEDYAACVSLVAAANETLEEPATQFELETAIAFTYFCQNHCDVVVLECGMGGRDDATNIVRNKICCVITSVSYDHMQYLGSSLSEIASVKAGIITSDCPVIAFDSGDEVISALKARCNITNSSLYTVSAPYPDIRTNLLGTFQTENAAVAYRTLCVVRDEDLIPGCDLSEDIIKAAFVNVKWPFRFEKICDRPAVYVDGAHNERAAYKLKETIDLCLCGTNIILVIGVFADKEYDKELSILAPCAKKILTVQTPDNPRALPAAELAKCAGKYCEDVTECIGIDDAAERSLNAAEAIERDGGPAAVVACGSLSYLYGFKTLVQNLTPPD